MKEVPVGTHRIVKRFLFLPLYLGSTFKWLETAFIEQIYYGRYYGWVDRYFVRGYEE